MALANLSHLGSAELIVILFLGLLIALFGILPFWLICKKVGLSPWLSLIILIPLGVFVLPSMLAFMDWPVLKKTGDN